MVKVMTQRTVAIQMLGLIVLSLSLISLLTHIETVQLFFSRASGEPANLIIDTQGVTGSLAKPWQMIAQGGETPTYRFQPVMEKLKAIKPGYVRIDHIFDFYTGITQDPNGNLVINWTSLDNLINDIREAGATPLVVLSYMPPALTANGDITGVPKNWSDWSTLIQLTIEHISGESGLNLPGVYYEVWNEPDLFGGWKTYGAKNYLTIYQNTIEGAGKARNVRPFLIGGPATTKIYENWFSQFMNFVAEKKLRLDFYSWHLYNANPEVFTDDMKQYDKLMRRYPEYIFKVEPIITEWGHTSSLDTGYDSAVSAAHLVAVNATLPPTLKKAFIFEFQDGESPSGQTYWGRWGLLTSQANGSLTKPRYETLTYLNRLGNEQLSLVGQGSWVKAIASKDADNAIKVVVTNYDPEDKHTETVPITFQRLSPGKYTLAQQYLGRGQTTTEIEVSGTSYSMTLPLPPNTVVYLEIQTK